MELQRLRLAETKQIYLAAKDLPPWCRFLLLGLLVWIEERWIDHKTVVAVNQAIAEYEKQHPPEVVLPPPIYSETGNDFFDEMRLSAPWKSLQHPSDSP